MPKLDGSGHVWAIGVHRSPGGEPWSCRGGRRCWQCLTNSPSPTPTSTPATASGFTLPATIADQGDKAAERFFTFFTDTIPNANTRDAYYRNAMRFFAWTASAGA